ncbi:MAG: rhodanese-like domain-containing protein [Chloroflexota bacterium]
MKKREAKIFLIMAVLALTIASCNPAASTEEPQFAPPVIIERNGIPRTEAEVPRVSLQETMAAIESGAAVIVDVRSAEAYAASHISGAISIPLSEIETNLTGLNLEKDQWIIAYCT